MKKNILILFVFLSSYAAVNGQRTANLKIRLTSPSNNSYIPSQTPFTFSAVIYNMDTVHIGHDDTIRLYLLTNNDSMFFMNVGGNGIVNHLKVFDSTLNPGDSLVFSNTMAFTNSYDNMTINLCLFAKPFNLARPIVDPQLSDNKACAVIHVREENSGIQVIGNKNGSVRIYPNPATNKFHVGSKDIIRSIHITDTEGRQTDMELPVSGVVDCSLLASGLYVISISTDRGIYTSRITIQN
jgi:hypothetical protein